VAAGLPLAYDVGSLPLQACSTMPPLDPEVLVRRHRVQRICRELSHLLQTSVEKRQIIDELLTKLENVTRGPKPLAARAVGRSTDGLSRG
jgi:hypothetical protein